MNKETNQKKKEKMVTSLAYLIVVNLVIIYIFLRVFFLYF